jgi:hypothetical protein
MPNGKQDNEPLPYATSNTPVHPSDRQSPMAYASIAAALFAIGWQGPALFKIHALPVEFYWRVMIGLSCSGLAAVFAYGSYLHTPRRHHLSHIAAALSAVALYLALHTLWPI